MSDEQKAPDPEEQKKFANEGDDVQAHRHGHGGASRADEGDDDGNDVEAHRHGHGGASRADEGDDDGDDVEAHFKGHNAG